MMHSALQRAWARARAGAPTAAVCAAGVWLGACGGAGHTGATQGGPAPSPSLREEGAKVFGTGTVPAPAPGTGGGATANAPAAGPANWAIAIASFRGDGNEKAAGIALARMRVEGGLPDAYAQRRGPSSVIVYGRYNGPDDPRAKADLSRIQGMQIGGMTPYLQAFLAPPPEAQVAVRSDYDLRKARQLFGKAAQYTLQVGWYGREDLARATEADLAEPRKAAEKAAATLRAEGELAFFYHGPNRSIVTIGIFDSTDFTAAPDPLTPPQQSPRLQETRLRHPLDLYNGAGYKVKTKTMRTGQLAPSMLVTVPKE